ncbi:10821_t:CDS:10 [Entrophospora sp. SA101]|nr:10821_t:CDS:10 [Entrophospora sp. SA101]
MNTQQQPNKAKSFSSTTATSATSTLCPTHSSTNSESYGQYNQNSDNNNNMMTTQALPQRMLYNSFTSLPAIYDNLNLNIDKLLCYVDFVKISNRLGEKLKKEFPKLPSLPSLQPGYPCHHRSNLQTQPKSSLLLSNDEANQKKLSNDNDNMQVYPEPSLIDPVTFFIFFQKVNENFHVVIDFPHPTVDTFVRTTKSSLLSINEIAAEKSSDDNHNILSESIVAREKLVDNKNSRVLTEAKLSINNETVVRSRVLSDQISSGTNPSNNNNASSSSFWYPNKISPSNNHALSSSSLSSSCKFKPENILVTDFGLAKKLTGAPELMKGYNASYQADRQLGNNHLRNVNRKHANDFDLNSNNEEAELSLRPD